MNKIKNFIEDIFLEINNKLFSSKYVVKGKCKKCGRCCRNILFSTQAGYIKSEEVFNKMKKKYPYYRNFRISGVVKDKLEFKTLILTDIASNSPAAGKYQSPALVPSVVYE